MYSRFTLVLLLLATTGTQKIDNDAIKNYSEFFNFGHKKNFDKIGRENYENSVIKSKVDILGAVFKQNIAFIKSKNLMDLVFLIDASSTVGQHNFDSELKFVKKLLSDVTVDYNHTRVAVITFSSQGNINKNIDEITNPKTENNKCLLLNKEINNIAYTCGATYTLGAFKAAKEILQNSRPNAEKVLFLITDGYSNGGDPIPVANELKQSQVTIFTIGISNGNIKELYEIATQPGELHSYLLDSFEEFESLARRALHVDLQSGDYYPLGISRPCDGLCVGGNCCDKNAYCTCGTSTGQYSCVCELGYYGSGLNNACSPCPSGSYADGPNLCLPCPDIQHFTKPPAILIESCKCKSGFKNNENSTCDVISCSKVLPLENGYFVKKKECSTVLNSACGVRCHVGFSLAGSSIRLCQDDGTWSGKEPTCQVKTCNKLPTPLHGSIDCKHGDLQNFSFSNSHMPVDTTCNFKCERGYTLVGSISRTCLPLAQWDGLRSACKQIKCNKLSKINFGFIEPKTCVLGKQPYGKECQYSCMDGFDLVGHSEKKCADGSWDNQDDVICKDVTLPDLACPENIIQETLPAKQYGIVTITIPLVTDNSYLNVTTWSKPASKGPYKFKIGTHQVSFYAQDAFKNKAKCSFNVTIVDKEPPTVEACVDPPVFISSGPANISWDEPNIYDNSQHVKIDRNATFGLFPVGEHHAVYTATDRSNNTSQCVLNITIEEPTCPPIAPPLYGTTKCNSSDGKTHCVVTCNEGYALPIPASANIIHDNTTQFYCAAQEATWTNIANLTSVDCTVSEIPVEVAQNGTIYLPDVPDACSNKNKLERARENVQKSLEENIIETCADGVECEITTEAQCNDIEMNNHLVKRDLTNATQPQKKRKRLNIRFQIKRRNRNRKVWNSKKIGFLSSGAMGKYNVTVNRPDIVCPIGSFKRKFKCIKCPMGSFHNVTSNSCQSCDIGSYNDKLGQANCAQCPKNYSTRKLHAKTNLDCIEKCMPGTFAHKKQIKHPKNHPDPMIERATLKPYCNSCPLGTYQPAYGQTNCTFCPANTTTAKRGAINITECEQLYHPCFRNPCQHGTCTSLGHYSYACECQEHYTGSNCEIFMNPCNSHPCQNDGKCSYSESFGYNGDRVTMFTTYICSCPEGYSGRSCALVANQCDMECMNNATCVLAEDDEPICLCTRGFTGKFCEEKIEKCKSNLCENNGICVEIDDEYKCICEGGYLGKRCQYVPCDFKPCAGNSICINGNSSIATQDNYSCICPESYTGPNCTELIDYCTNKPCQNNGVCNSIIGNYTCTCTRGVKGVNCEIVLSSDYILNFPRSGVTDYVEMKGFDDDLSAISVCLWMLTNDSFNYGTILSYANRDYYNAFTVTDYTGIVLYINNHYVVTDVFLNDGEWHHVCITWNSQSGSYHIYLDSNLVNNGTDLSKSKVINGKGKFILGQEQDTLGGKFSQSESFLGKLTQLDVFNHDLTPTEVKILMNNCKRVKTTQDNVYVWSEFAENIRGDVSVENNTFCGQCDTPPTPAFGSVKVQDSTALYTCDKGYILNKYHQGRKCLKSTRWEGEEPICLAISCGHPAYIPNGYFVGNNFTFKHQIEYKCNRGFNLTGSANQLCNETGRWFPNSPKCLGVQCPKPIVHRRATVSVQQIEDDAIEVKFAAIDSFQSGTQIDIRCPNSKLLDEETTLTCMPDGKWDFDPPTCKGQYTLPCNINHVPEAPDNGYRDEDSYNELLEGTSDTILYVCRQGYRQINGNFSTCIVDGYWSELNMQCQVITCKEPRHMSEYGLEITDGKATVYPLGHMIRYGCIGYYASVGNFVARCVYPGTWSRFNGYCQKMLQTP